MKEKNDEVFVVPFMLSVLLAFGLKAMALEAFGKQLETYRVVLTHS